MGLQDTKGMGRFSNADINAYLLKTVRSAYQAEDKYKDNLPYLILR